MQSGLAEVSKTGPSRIYVADPWSQIGCPSLCSKMSYSRFGNRGLLRKYERARFSTSQLDQIDISTTFAESEKAKIKKFLPDNSKKKICRPKFSLFELAASIGFNFQKKLWLKFLHFCFLWLNVVETLGNSVRDFSRRLWTNMFPRKRECMWFIL